VLASDCGGIMTDMDEMTRVWVLYDSGSRVGVFATEALAEESRELHGGGEHLEVTWWPILTEPMAPRPEPEPVPWDQLSPEERELSAMFGRTGDE
jgi:hypothetical protein